VKQNKKKKSKKDLDGLFASLGGDDSTAGNGVEAAAEVSRGEADKGEGGRSSPLGGGGRGVCAPRRAGGGKGWGAGVARRGGGGGDMISGAELARRTVWWEQLVAA
jgi:hypothetical protein